MTLYSCHSRKPVLWIRARRESEDCGYQYNCENHMPDVASLLWNDRISITSLKY
jgi:hypothetical protein